MNISVALYSTLFDMTTTLHDEKELYLKLKENKQEQNGSPDKRDNNIQTSSQFFIKNNTGELMKYYTERDPIFYEL